MLNMMVKGGWGEGFVVSCFSDGLGIKIVPLDSSLSVVGEASMVHLLFGPHQSTILLVSPSQLWDPPAPNISQSMNACNKSTVWCAMR